MSDLARSDRTPTDEPEPELFKGDGPAPDVNLEIAMLCDHLLERGVQLIQIDYSGSGDSGGTEGWSTEPDDAPLDRKIAERIVDLAEQWTCNCDFNNEGSHGTFRLWPGPKLVEQQHFDHFEDAEPQALPQRQLSKKLRSDLRTHGVTQVEVQWNGAGDSGSLDDWYCVNRDGAEVPVPHEVMDRLEDLILGGLPDGCEINEGSFGTITVLVRSGVVRYDFHNRIAQQSDGQYTRWRLLQETQERKEEADGEPVSPRPE